MRPDAQKILIYDQLTAGGVIYMLLAITANKAVKRC